MSYAQYMPLSGTRKAAILLSLLGEDSAAVILRHLPKEDTQRVTDEVATLGHVSSEVALRVLEEYHELAAAQEFAAVGGQDVAARFLVKAFGENTAKGMVQKIARPDESTTVANDALRKADPAQIARALANENAQTKALILGQLDPKQASAVLVKLKPGDRAECVRRMANLGDTSPEVAARVSNVLVRRLRTTGDKTKRSKKDFRNVAELMNRLDSATAHEILEDIQKEEPKLAIGIRDLMFTFEDLLQVPELQLRELVSALDKKVLVIALKGASEELRSHFFRTMSDRAVEVLQEDAEDMGPVRAKEVHRAQSEIVSFARKLESEGKLLLKSEGVEEYVL